MTLDRTRPLWIALLVGLLGAPALADDSDRPEPRPIPVQMEGGAEGDAPPAADAPGTPAEDAASAPAAAPAGPAPLTRGLAGPYLAARMATVENDFRAAARYFVQAVAQDPSDPYLQDSALVALTSAGDLDRAVAFAERMVLSGSATELAGLLHRAKLVKDGAWDELLAFLETSRSVDLPITEDLMDGTIQGWALMGAGRGSDSLAAFQALAASESLAPVANYHLALAQAIVGDYDSAEALLAQEGTGDHLLGLVARVQVLAQLDRRDEAEALLAGLPGLEAEPQLLDLQARLAAGAPVSFDIVGGPSDGIAQLLLAFASALSGGPDPEPLSLIHARLAVWLAPENAEARLIAAQLLQERQQFDLAEAEYEAVRAMGQLRPAAELSRIDALARAGRRPEAENAALALSAAYPSLAQAWVALGDVLRQQEKYTTAVPAYDKALQLLSDAPPEARWFPLYARGIALERAGQFERAEADLLAALEIRPDQASLLNYLGYSWIDRNQNLEQALEMIKKAVELAPGDGYILDSLAWAYYRLGRYEEAVAPMEQAIATMASDPLVNDHLGDIYWKVGRTREAEIQWKRALSLEPAESGEVDPARIRAKLERGLDAVLADEAGTDSRAAPQPQTEADASE
ncbi:tetratricopeptide repeat protein [Paracoccus tibetensis]|uniref:Tetratricopeptide repeat-containing protein n=1 Tax=Paracoccus tibetensis TaxID=336292 RepID=A0A1G5J9W2_9RHOB|nr:tetratricopeptide repeat protein [Paracoccus tibetensis]SCY85166.1 Tetratricopeptide repeat-containing protein [Paracoccus tibetensis]